MRILIDARSVRTPAGLQVFRGLAAGWIADPRVRAVVAVVPTGFDRTAVPAGVECTPDRGSGWLRHLMIDLPRIADEVAADVIFSPNATPPRDRRAVMYCQDLKHFRPPGIGLPGWKWRVREIGRLGWRRYAAGHALLAIGTSNDIAREVARHISLPIVTIPNGVEVGSRRWAGDRDRVFVMGGIGPWKREETAISAWSRLDKGRRGGTILELGGVGPPSRLIELRQYAERLGVGDSVEVTGTLPHEEFLDRIAGARVSLSCSLFEAFGLPVAEALVLGAPVICTDLPAHRELLERAGAGCAFPAGDQQRLTELLNQTLDGSPPRRRHDPPAGWSWAARAAEHLDAYETHLD